MLWLRSSTPLLTTLVTNNVDSICIVTTIRIKNTVDNHGTNSQAVYSLIALFTCLEALFGVINACLPVMKPILTKFKSSKAKDWLSSVLSGSIPIFIRRSQMDSVGKSYPSVRRKSYLKHGTPTELPRWPSDGTLGGPHDRSPLPQYGNARTANRAFASPSYDRLDDALSRSPSPPVPRKGKRYIPKKRWATINEQDTTPAPAIYVQREWDVESGARSEETDRKGLVGGAERW